MKIVKCPRCKKEFEFTDLTDITSPLCGECRQKEQEEYEAIRNFLSKRPGASLLEVAKEVGVSETKLLKYLKQGSITTTRGGIHGCHGCGKLIEVGKFCDSCMMDDFKNEKRL